jgi:hypothetical protein
MIAWPAKDPADELDFNWIVPLDAGDSIAVGGFTASIASGAATIVGAPTFSGSIATVFLAGGVADASTFVTLTAVTAGGRTFRETAVLPVIDRASAVLAAFRLRYSAFATIDDGQISYWLADGGAQVSAWAETDKPAGRLAYAAHKLAEQGLGAAGAIPAGVTGFKSGTFSAQVSDSVSRRIGFHSTIYGREFLDLARRSFGGPRLAHTPPVSF